MSGGFYLFVLLMWCGLTAGVLFIFRGANRPEVRGFIDVARKIDATKSPHRTQKSGDPPSGGTKKSK